MDTEELAALALREALDKVKPFEAKLDAIEKQISEAEGDSGDYRAKLNSEKISEKIAARAYFTEFDKTMGELEKAKDDLEQQMWPYLAEVERAKKSLAIAAEERRDLEFNVSSPAYAYAGYGKQTRAYRGFRVMAGHTVPILMEGNSLNAEYDLDIMDQLAIRTGYRTNHIDENAARRERNYWDSFMPRRLTSQHLLARRSSPGFTTSSLMKGSSRPGE